MYLSAPYDDFAHYSAAAAAAHHHRAASSPSEKSLKLAAPSGVMERPIRSVDDVIKSFAVSYSGHETYEGHHHFAGHHSSSHFGGTQEYSSHPEQAYTLVSRPAPYKSSAQQMYNSEPFSPYDHHQHSGHQENQSVCETIFLQHPPPQARSHAHSGTFGRAPQNARYRDGPPSLQPASGSHHHSNHSLPYHSASSSFSNARNGHFSSSSSSSSASSSTSSSPVNPPSSVSSASTFPLQTYRGSHLYSSLQPSAGS